MTLDSPALELKLVRPGDGIEVDLLPLQGLWTEEQYFALSDQINHLIEFVDGRIEVLPMPTSRHQAIVLWLYERFKAALGGAGGPILVAPLRMLVRPGVFREPDILMLLDPADPRYQDAYWLGADLVVEVVSPADRARDLVDKRADYAAAGIPEYWIVDPDEETITVLVIEGDDHDDYVERGTFRRGERAGSVRLAGFGVDVAEALDAGS